MPPDPLQRAVVFSFTVVCLLFATGLLAAISLGLMFGLVIGSISLGALYVHRRRSVTVLLNGPLSLTRLNPTRQLTDPTEPKVSQTEKIRTQPY